MPMSVFVLSYDFLSEFFHEPIDRISRCLPSKNLDELSKYKALLERATVLNRSMTADLPDEQAATMSNEIADVNEQWKILIDGLNTLKERFPIDFQVFLSCILIFLVHLKFSFRHSSRYNSPEPNRLARQNENLINYIQSWINLGKELIKQEEQMTMSKISMIDETKIDDDSLLSNDNNQRHNDLLHQLRVRVFIFVSDMKIRFFLSVSFSRNVKKK